MPGIVLSIYPPKQHIEQMKQIVWKPQYIPNRLATLFLHMRPVYSVPYLKAMAMAQYRMDLSKGIQLLAWWIQRDILSKVYIFVSLPI